MGDNEVVCLIKRGHLDSYVIKTLRWYCTGYRPLTSENCHSRPGTPPSGTSNTLVNV